MFLSQYEKPSFIPIQNTVTVLYNCNTSFYKLHARPVIMSSPGDLQSMSWLYDAVVLSAVGAQGLACALFQIAVLI